jgi:hypothetical protein
MFDPLSALYAISMAFALSFWPLDATAQPQLTQNDAVKWWRGLNYPPSDQLISGLTQVLFCLVGVVIVASLDALLGSDG